MEERWEGRVGRLERREVGRAWCERRLVRRPIFWAIPNKGVPVMFIACSTLSFLIFLYCTN
jgi:hypothetical protein